MRQELLDRARQDLDSADVTLEFSRDVIHQTVEVDQQSEFGARVATRIRYR